jgi:hypothetical protein
MLCWYYEKAHIGAAVWVNCVVREGLMEDLHRHARLG